MNPLLDAVAVLACLLVVAVAVLAGLRVLVPYGPRRVGRSRRRLTVLAAVAGCWAVLVASAAVQTAFGAPVGERRDPTVVVLEAGECDRPLSGLGLVRSCGPVSYRADDRPPPEAAVVVAARDRVAAGDRVAVYEVSAWEWLVRPLSAETVWRRVAEEDRPDLTWLPAAAVAAYALVVFAAAGRPRLAGSRAAAASRGSSIRPGRDALRRGRSGRGAGSPG